MNITAAPQVVFAGHTLSEEYMAELMDLVYMKNTAVVVISKSGKVIRIAVDTIRKTGRNAQGVKIMELKDDDVVVSMVPVVKTDSEAPAAETQTQP